MEHQLGDRLIEYLQKHFVDSEVNQVPCAASENEEVMEAWNQAYASAKEQGAYLALNQIFGGKLHTRFAEEDLVTLAPYASFAGTIPVISFGNTQDFESFLVELVYKGIRPEGIASMGAMFLAGKRNRCIVLSRKPYSNVTAQEMGLSDALWDEKSYCIRRVHECCHYYTKRRYGVAMNHVHDEIIADFIGLLEAFGEYKAEYFWRFMGIIPGSGNRLKLYIPDLEHAQYEQLCAVVKNATLQLEAWSHREDVRKMSYTQMIDILCEKSILDWE